MVLSYLLGCVLIAWTALKKERWESYLKRSKEDWLLDLPNLFIQGIAIPWIQLVALYGFLEWVIPEGKGVVSMPFLFSFLLNFVVVDYLYYWNHRLLHHKIFFPLHHVHHTAERMDILVSSRNTLWSSFLILYLWINGLMIFLLKDVEGYLWGVGLTAGLDLWRHSELSFSTHSKMGKFIAVLGLVSPLEHAQHHGKRILFNFGANWNWWDKWHGTYYYPASAFSSQSFSQDNFKGKLGIPCSLSLGQKLFFPFKFRKKTIVREGML